MQSFIQDKSFSSFQSQSQIKLPPINNNDIDINPWQNLDNNILQEFKLQNNIQQLQQKEMKQAQKAIQQQFGKTTFAKSKSSCNIQPVSNLKNKQLLSIDDRIQVKMMKSELLLQINNSSQYLTDQDQIQNIRNAYFLNSLKVQQIQKQRNFIKQSEQLQQIPQIQNEQKQKKEVQRVLFKHRNKTQQVKAFSQNTKDQKHKEKLSLIQDPCNMACKIQTAIKNKLNNLNFNLKLKKVGQINMYKK